MIRRKPLRRHTPLRAYAQLKGLRRSKTPAKYKGRLWKLFSEYVRRRYSDSNGIVSCVTCGDLAHWALMDAGHYHPRTDGLSLYFDEQNVHPQCTACNRFRRGHLTRYALYLQKTYGAAILEALDAKRREFRKITEWEYLELIDAYKRKLDALPQLPDAPEKAV